MPERLVIIPTYNEQENIREILAHVFRLEPAFEVLVVDDGSPDGTARTVKELQGTHAGRLHLIERSGKLGLGTAYITGFRWALERGYAYIFEMDADFSHDPSYLPAMLARAQGGADVVVGSRYVAGGGTRNWGVGRKLISRGGSLYARTVLGVKVRDVTAGFICYRRGALQALDLAAIKSNGYSFQIEMKYRALAAGLKVAEVPIVFVDRRVGKSKMSRAIFAEALTMVWKLRFGR